MDYNFYCRIPLDNAHSKHILIILLIDWRNLRKLPEWFSVFQWDEDRTQNRTFNSLRIKTWNFSRMTILKPQNFASWAGSITNEIMLLYLWNANRHEIFLLLSKGLVKTKTHVCWVCRYMWKLCKHILRKNSSKRNAIKGNCHSYKFLNYFLVGFTKCLNEILSSIWKVISPRWEK